jgi:hypothetical protein
VVSHRNICTLSVSRAYGINDGGVLVEHSLRSLTAAHSGKAKRNVHEPGDRGVNGVLHLLEERVSCRFRDGGMEREVSIRIMATGDGAPYETLVRLNDSCELRFIATLCCKARGFPFQRDPHLQATQKTSKILCPCERANAIRGAMNNESTPSLLRRDKSIGA